MKFTHMTQRAFIRRLQRLAEVEYQTGLKESPIYKKITEGTFPAPVKLGKRHVAWRSDEIQQWIEDRPRVDR